MIELDSVSASIGPIQILNGISLKAPAGRFVTATKP